MTNPSYKDPETAKGFQLKDIVEKFDTETDLTEGINPSTRNNILSEDTFFGYTTEKQCTIKMVSGVDIRINDLETNFLKSEGEDPNLSYLRKNPSGLARQYILQSGTQYYNEVGIETTSTSVTGQMHGDYMREGIADEGNMDAYKAYAYGDRNIRANAQDGFGRVPMPGIIDAEIRTKSDNGALREAKVNFVCHNRRQLEILEMLFMRPGYPILLEWGWDPYIDNEGKKQQNNFSIREEFFNNEQTLDSLNAKIKKYKETSGGNFDGFIGYCKNFSFKSNDIGGYQCTTEIMAHGEIIESLKSQKSNHNFYDSQGNLTVDIQDSLLYYLRSVRNTMKSPSSTQFYQDHKTPPVGMMGEEYIEWEHGEPGKPYMLHYKHDYDFSGTSTGRVGLDHGQDFMLPTWDSMRTDIGYVGYGCPTYYRNKEIVAINYSNVEFFTCIYEDNVGIPVFIDPEHLKNNPGFEPETYNTSLMTHNEEKGVTLSRDYYENRTWSEYQQYFIANPGKETSWGVNPVSMYTSNWWRSSAIGGFSNNLFGFFENGEWGVQRDLITRMATPTSIGDNLVNMTDKERIQKIEAFQKELTNINIKMKSYEQGYLDIIHLYQHIQKINFSEALTTKDLPALDSQNNPIAGIGLEAFLGGAVLKQVVKYDETSADSGYKKNVFIRWDLLCQMINHLSTYKSDKYSEIKKDDAAGKKKYFENYKLKHPQTELTYMSKNTRTWNNEKTSKNKKKQTQNDHFYLPYTAPYINSSDPIKTMIELKGTPYAKKNEQPGLGYNYNGKEYDNLTITEDENGNTTVTTVNSDGDTIVISESVPINQMVPGGDEWDVVYNEGYTSEGIINQMYEGQPDYPSITFANTVDGYVIPQSTFSLPSDSAEVGYPTIDLSKGLGYNYNGTMEGEYDISGASVNFDRNLDGNEYYYDKEIWDQYQSIQNTAALTGQTYNYGLPQIEYSHVNNLISHKAVKKKNLTNDDYHPLIGASLDESVCLMPHQAIFDSLFSEDAEGKGFTRYDETIYNNYNRWSEEKKKSEIFFRALSSYDDSQGEVKKVSDRHSIGYVYFNLDFVISTYENIRLKDYVTNSDNSYFALNKNFNMFDFIKALWDGVNVSTGHYYNFIMHTEHERPHVNRIIDYRVSGDPKLTQKTLPDIFKFSPQGLKSITRQLYYDSAISNDLASTIAIAATNPRDMEELNALSFKSFNKNIKSRFKDFDALQEVTPAQLKQNLISDVIKYNELYNSLVFYLYKLYEGNKQSETLEFEQGTTVPYVSLPQALTQLEQLRELRLSINNRVALYDKDNNENPNAGEWLVEVTHDISPIIPIKFNIEMDGLSGLLPLQLFQIDKDRLPLGYQSPNVAFIVNSEVNKIGNNQDWITQISGQMCFLNGNANTGINKLPEGATGFLNEDGNIKIRPKWQDITLEDLGIEEAGPPTPNADKARDHIFTAGHKENNYVIGGNNHKPGVTREGYKSGELSSNGDITAPLEWFIFEFIQMMKSPILSTEYPVGISQLTADYSDYNFEMYDDATMETTLAFQDFPNIAWTLEGMQKLKFRFTAGNDIYHKNRGGYHPKGKAVDFVLETQPFDDPGTSMPHRTLDVVIAFLKLMKSKGYPNMRIGDEYRQPEFADLPNDYTGAPDGYTHPHSDVYAQNEQTEGAHIHIELQ